MSLNLLQRRVAWAIVVIPAAVLCSLSACLQCGALLRLYRHRCQILASNEVIDGRPRRGASHVGSKHLVGELRPGFSYGMGRWTVTYLMAWRGAEFSTPDMPNPPSVNYASIMLVYE